MTRFSYTTYNKVLVELRTSLRGATFNKNDFLKEMTVLDETIVNFAPLVTRFEKQYAKKFLSIQQTLLLPSKEDGGQFCALISSPGPSRTMSHRGLPLTSCLNSEKSADLHWP